MGQSSIFTRRTIAWTLIACAAVSVLLFFLTPPAPARVETGGWDDLAARTVAGAYHVHTTRSDGHGDKTAVAAAAARAGLRFVILTDHGDGTRPPDPPEYLHGVLMIDAVEISTDNGHYVALDMPRAPYPLGGAGDAVVEDVHRLGGFGVAAHPDSPKAALRWTDTTAPVDGIEWLNADSEWRDEGRGRLVRAGITYFFRPAASLATLLDRPATLGRWDALLRTRRVIGLAGSDAHGGPGRRVEDPSRTFFSTLGMPSYDASFRELGIRAVLQGPLAGTAAEDARAILDAIRKGSVFSVIDALASPALLDFHAAPSGSTVTLAVRATLPRGAELVLIGPGGELARGAGELRREVPADRPAAYRVEARLAGAPGAPPVPWLVSNPIIVGRLETAPPSEPVPAPARDGQFPWRIEKDPASSAILRTPGTSAELEYHLADGARASQFVALASDLHAQTFGGIRLTASADRPARIGVQVRTADGRRWGRSYYVDPAGTAIEARLSEFRPIGDPAAPGMTPSESLSSVLVVVDLTNALPGHTGRLVLRSSELVK
jgi:hypothetical protein